MLRAHGCGDVKKRGQKKIQYCIFTLTPFYVLSLA